MTAPWAGALFEHAGRLTRGGDAEQRPDPELLRRYAAGDEASFAALVRRHGAMVWHVCRRALGHHHDAEDVFQATFLVLARKAGAVAWRASVAPWLFAVAQRLARKARLSAARGRAQPPDRRPAPDLLEEMTGRDLLAALDAELAGLSESCRGPVVLCLLEGRTQEETARLLGTSLSTVRRRLDRGKRLLQARLTRRGLAPTAVVALALPGTPAPAVPARLLAAARRAPTARAAALAEGLLNAAVPGFRAALALLLTACTALAGAVLVGRISNLSGVHVRMDCKSVLQPRDPEKERRDALGDPLPPDALLRLGSARLRHFGTLQCAAWSPDGKLLASGGWDRAVRLWDAATGKELGQLVAPERGVTAVAFSPDSKLLAGAGVASAVCLWEVRGTRENGSRKELRLLTGHRGEVRAVAFSPRGDVLASGDSASLRLWEVGSGKELKTFKVDKGGVHAVAFSPDGRVVAAACADATVRLWDTRGSRLLQHLRGHGGAVEAVAFSADGKHLVTTASGQALLWETATGKKLGPIGPPKGRSVRAAFAPVGEVLALAGDDHAIRLWNLATGKQVLELPRHPDRVRSLSFSPDGKALAAVSDNVIHLWDASTGRPRGPLRGHQGRLTSVAYTPDGRGIATTGWDGTVRLWDAATGAEKRRFQTSGGGPWAHILDPGRLSCVALSPDGRLVAVVRGDETVVVWDIRTGKEAHRFRAGIVAFSPDGRLVACGERGRAGGGDNAGVICLYDLGTGKPVRQLRGHLTPIASLAFTADGRRLISRGVVFMGFRTGEPGESETTFVRVWDVGTGQELPVFPAGANAGRLALAPDGRSVARVGRDEEALTLWEAATGRLRANLAGHTGMVFDLAFSPDGRALASAGMDGTVRLWDVPTGKEVGRLAGHRGWVLCLAFAPDGRTLVSGGIDTTALVWDLGRIAGRRGRPIELSAAELGECWKELGGGPTTAFRAAGRLASSPGRAVPFLREQLRPVRPADGARLARLIEALDSSRFGDRERAEKELEGLEALAVPALRKALSANPSLELKRRVEALLDRLESARLSGETLRQVRAVEVLEWAATPGARLLLEALAEGAPEARLTREARAAVRRLARP